MNILKKISKVLFYILLLFSKSLFAQIPDVSYIDATASANTLAGNNVTVSNASFSGHEHQLAWFADGLSKVGFPSGVLLTTGDASFATEWGCLGCGESINVSNGNTDADLDILNGFGNVKAPAILEFDLISTGTSLEFEFIFASKEYPEYANGNFNDAFGFFLSGPGISGPYSNSAENIAKLPNGTEISINTVNHLTNSSYYIGNPWFNQGTLSESNALFRYDGKTTVITVSKTIQCNQTYHLKIAICNTSDKKLDSGVFLKQGSIRSDFQLGALTADVQPICEGQNLNLSIQGDNGWTYTWSTGQSGVGLKNISTVAATNITSVSVTATNQDGCSVTKTIPIAVHPKNNIAPATTGVDGTGGFTYYIQANSGYFNFNVASFDAANEKVDMSYTATSLPSITSFNITNALFHDGGQFDWPYPGPLNADIGVHSFDVTVTDQNACGALSSTDTYNINVVCRHCPLDVYYQDRHPNNRPLPPYTGSGRKIVAGSNVDSSQPYGDVETGTATVTFEAPQIIEMVPGFTGGPGYTAQINPTTCTDNCETCCDNWSGFTHDVIPNFFTPNADGYFDVWTVLDTQHPFCAFGAQEFDIKIVTPSGSIAFTQSGGTPSQCCPFRSSSVSCPNPPCFPTPRSDIYWDGIINHSIFGLPTGRPAPNGTYYYVLDLKGCGGKQSYTGFITLLGGLAKQGSTQGTTDLVPDFSTLSLAEQKDITKNSTANIDENKDVENQLQIYPNPAKDKISIKLTNNESIQNGVLEVFTTHGRLIHTKKISDDVTESTLNVTNYSKGTYFMKLTVNKTVYNQFFVKD